MRLCGVSNERGDCLRVFVRRREFVKYPLVFARGNRPLGR